MCSSPTTSTRYGRMSLPGKGRSNRCAFSVLATRGHVRPQSVDFIRLEQVAPRRHGVFALRYRADEPLALIAREFAQIGCALRIGHARAVARGTVPRIRFRTAFDLLWLERVLRRRGVRRGEQRAEKDYFLQPGHTAHREKPIGFRRSGKALRRFTQASGQTSTPIHPAAPCPQSPSLPKSRRRGRTAR